MTLPIAALAVALFALAFDLVVFHWHRLSRHDREKVEDEMLDLLRHLNNTDHYLIDLSGRLIEDEARLSRDEKKIRDAKHHRRDS